MKFTDWPFIKVAYGDKKSRRNFIEVAAVALAAEKLGIKYAVVDACCHAYYCDVELDNQERVLEYAKTRITRKEAVNFMEELKTRGY